MIDPISDAIRAKKIAAFIRKEAATRRGIDGGKNPTIVVAPNIHKLLKGYMEKTFKLAEGTLAEEKITVHDLDILEGKLLDDDLVCVIATSQLDQFKDTWGIQYDTAKDAEVGLDDQPEHVLPGTEGPQPEVPGRAREDLREEAAPAWAGPGEGDDDD